MSLYRKSRIQPNNLPLRRPGLDSAPRRAWLWELTLTLLIASSSLIQVTPAEAITKLSGGEVVQSFQISPDCAARSAWLIRRCDFI